MSNPVVASTGAYTESGAAGTSHQKTGLSLASGSMIYVCIGAHAATQVVTSVTDNIGNVYEYVKSNQRATVDAEIWRTKKASTGTITSITVTTGSSVGVVFRYYELTGAQQGNDHAPASANGSSTAPASGTTSTPLNTTGLNIGVLAVGAAATFTSPTFTTSAGTSAHDASTTTSSAVDIESGYRAASAVTAQSYSATITSAAWAACCVTVPLAVTGFNEVNSTVSQWKFEPLEAKNVQRVIDMFYPVTTDGQLFPQGIPVPQR